MTVDIEQTSFFLDVRGRKKQKMKMDTNLNKNPGIVCYQWW